MSSLFEGVARATRSRLAIKKRRGKDAPAADAATSRGTIRKRIKSFRNTVTTSFLVDSRSFAEVNIERQALA
jgi:hypothetical protein